MTYRFGRFDDTGSTHFRSLVLEERITFCWTVSDSAAICIVALFNSVFVPTPLALSTTHNHVIVV